MLRKTLGRILLSGAALALMAGVASAEGIGASLLTQQHPFYIELADAMKAEAEAKGVPLEISPLMVSIFDDGIARYGERAQSDRIIERLEEATGLSIIAPGFPAEMIDDEPEEPGYEVVPPR